MSRSDTHKRLFRGLVGSLAAMFLAGAVGSLAAPYADLAQVLGIYVGSAGLGGLWGSR